MQAKVGLCIVANEMMSASTGSVHTSNYFSHLEFKWLCRGFQVSNLPYDASIFSIWGKGDRKDKILLPRSMAFIMHKRMRPFQRPQHSLYALKSDTVCHATYFYKALSVITRIFTCIIGFDLITMEILGTRSFR